MSFSINIYFAKKINNEIICYASILIISYFLKSMILYSVA